MNKNVKATKNTVTTKATVKEEKQTPVQRKTSNTTDALHKIRNKMKNAKLVKTLKIKASELCERVLGAKPDIIIPDFQRAPFTFKQAYMDRLMSGVVRGVTADISKIMIAIYNGELYIVDGLQRCSAFYKFLRGEMGFYVVEDDIKVADTLKIVYKTFKVTKEQLYELEDDLKKEFDEFNFTVEFYECETMEQMRDLFMSVNTSTSVSSTAKIKAYSDEKILAEVSSIMHSYKSQIKALPVRNINSDNNGDAVVNQWEMIQDFFLMCVYSEHFTGQKYTRITGSIGNFSKKYSRIKLSKTKLAEARTLFNKCMDLMSKLCIDSSKKNVTTYRIAFILILNIIKAGKQKYFDEANALSDALENMTVLPTTSGQCASLTQMYEKQIDLYNYYILPYIQKVDAELEELYNVSDDDNDDDKFVA